MVLDVFACSMVMKSLMMRESMLTMVELESMNHLEVYSLNLMYVQHRMEDVIEP